MAITIPRDFLKQTGLKPGDEVLVEQDITSKTLTITSKVNSSNQSVTPEFYEWLEGFNKQYPQALKELADK